MSPRASHYDLTRLTTVCESALAACGRSEISLRLSQLIPFACFYCTMVTASFHSCGGHGYAFGACLGRVLRAVWVMLHADDTGFALRSSAGLACMAVIIVKVLSEFGLSVSEKKTKILMMRVPNKSRKTTTAPANGRRISAGQNYGQTGNFRYQGGLVARDGTLERETTCRGRAVWFSGGELRTAESVIEAYGAATDSVTYQENTS